MARNKSVLALILTADTAEFNASLSEVNNKFIAFGDTMGKIGKGLSKKLTLPLLGFGALAVNEFAKAEHAANSLNSIDLLAIEEFKKSWSESMAAIGAAVIRVAQPIMDAIKGWMEGFKNLSPETQKLVVTIGGLVAAMGPALMAIGYLAKGPIPLLTSGFGALRNILTSSKTPWALLTAAIVAAGVETYRTMEIMDVAGQTAERMAEFNSRVADSYIEEEAIIKRLVATASDENAKKADRLNAISQLNQISPEYLGNLNLENIKTQEGTALINNYLAALRTKIEMQAREERMVEIAKERNKAMADLTNLYKQATDAGGGFFDIAQAVVDNWAVGSNNAQAQLAVIASLDEEMKLHESTLAGYQEKLIQLPSQMDLVSTSMEKMRTSAENLRVTMASGLMEPIQATSVQNIQGNIETDVQGFGPMSEAMENHMDKLEEVKATYTSLGDHMGQFFASQVAQGKDANEIMLSMMIETTKQVIKALLAQAIAGYAAANTATLGPWGLALAAAAPSVIGALFDSIIPQFAEGGIVNRATLGIFGEAGPEAVIPLDRMSEFTGNGAGVQVYGEFVLDGLKLKAAVKRADNYQRQTGLNY